MKYHYNSNFFSQWLGGLIDADGCFSISTKGYGSLEITMDSSEVQTLYFIKKKLGCGSVTLRSKANAFRYRLHKKEHLIFVLNSVNGNIRTINKRKSFERICILYDIKPLEPKPLIIENSWFAGFLSGDGSFSINKKNYQCTIAVSQKESSIIEDIQKMMNGHIYYEKSWHGWVWYTSKKETLNNIFFYLTYNKLMNPKKEASMKSMQRFLRYKELGYHLQPEREKKLQHFIKVFQKNQNKYKRKD